jgi:hypothetical protein
MFVALEVNVYAVPFVNPDTVQEPLAPVTVQVAFPGDAVTVYEVGVPPVVGALTVTVAWALPATAVAVPGLPGTVMFVELLVTDCEVNVAASFPVESCTADESLLDVGSVYETSTVLPWSTAVARFNTTVDPDTTADETVTAPPFAVTTNALAAAVVTFKASLNVSVRVVPLAARTAPFSVGDTLSTGVTDTDDDATESPALFTAFK